MASGVSGSSGGRAWAGVDPGPGKVLEEQARQSHNAAQEEGGGRAGSRGMHLNTLLFGLRSKRCNNSY